MIAVSVIERFIPVSVLLNGDYPVYPGGQSPENTRLLSLALAFTRG
ncbi:hypothetical protein HMPREF0201_02767 [Cedecea davisae DSM 4568]|uniref:Uncharacterized protein n=1 Tax=Cedecea davisae DSM 4568 TaxID=566551 RepID=S3J8J2_9ENTR|nr:hypothetical protein HMPREF0201_02767 [Cedecea davisae DSM 4568]